VIVDSAVYRHGRKVECGGDPHDYARMRELAAQEGGFTWVGLHEPTQEELGTVAKAFDLHELSVEDAVEAHQRPKLEHYDDHLFLVLKTLWYVDEEDAVETGEISLFLGSDFVVTVRHGHGNGLADARLGLEGDSSVLEHGPAAVAYAVCDRVVDEYVAVVDELQIDVDEVEVSVFSEERTHDAARIYTLKREISEVRRAVLPLRDPMSRFASGQVPGVSAEAAPFFRDVMDHLARTAEEVDNLDDLLSTAFDAHVAHIQMQQNEDMRKISAGAALVVVPTLIAGIYGMNFRHMPELGWTLGYPFALLLMGGMSGLLWWFFRRSGWL